MEIHVAYTIDVQGPGAFQFLDQLKCGLYCLRKTKKPEDTIIVHIVSANVPGELIVSTMKLNTETFKIEYVPIGKPNLDYLQSFTNNQPNSNIRTWNGIVYARLFLAKQLSKVDRVIYLDTDTMVRKPLNELWETDMGDKFFGMAMGYTIEYGFNSGIMLMDLAAIRKADVWKDLEEHMREWAKRYYLPDQTVINKFFADKIYELPKKWNYPPKGGMGSPKEELEGAHIWHWYFPDPKQHRPNEVERCNAVWFAELLEADAAMA